MPRTSKTTKKRTEQRKSDATYAGMKRRLVAFAYDYILIAIYIGILTATTLGLTALGRPLDRLFADAVSSDLSAFFLLILPVIVYFGWQEGSTRQSSWGKRRVGLRVTSAKGQPIGYTQSFLRSILKFVPWQMAHTAIFQLTFANSGPTIGIYLLLAAAYGLAIVYIVAIWRRQDHRALYDELAGTAVILPNEFNQPNKEKVK